MEWKTIEKNLKGCWPTGRTLSCCLKGKEKKKTQKRGGGENFMDLTKKEKWTLFLNSSLRGPRVTQGKYRNWGARLGVTKERRGEQKKEAPRWGERGGDLEPNAEEFYGRPLLDIRTTSLSERGADGKESKRKESPSKLRKKGLIRLTPYKGRRRGPGQADE